MIDLIVNQEKPKHKKRASFLKIYIEKENFKLNVIPIPLWLAKGTISFILRIIKLAMRFKKEDLGNFSKSDINEILSTSKEIIKVIRQYPPFSIVEIESHNTKISIRTK